MSNYDITAIPTDKTDVKQCPGAESGIIPKHPFRGYIIGASGSGKTNLLLNLMTRDEFYKGYFDSICVISPTANGLDQSYKVLEQANPQRVLYFNEPDVSILKRIEKVQKKEIKKKGLKNAEKCLIIMDDCISYKKFMNSKILLKFAVMSRHFNVSIFLLSQAYHRVPKSIRLNMSCFYFFRGSQKECAVLCEDLCAPSYSNRKFTELINHATKNRYEFLKVDLNTPIEEGRYRKNLEENLI